MQFDDCGDAMPDEVLETWEYSVGGTRINVEFDDRGKVHLIATTPDDSPTPTTARTAPSPEKKGGAGDEGYDDVTVGLARVGRAIGRGAGALAAIDELVAVENLNDPVSADTIGHIDPVGLDLGRDRPTHPRGRVHVALVAIRNLVWATSVTSMIEVPFDSTLPVSGFFRSPARLPR
ncbi:MAG TPA: hypothetical protein VGG57_10570 [Stellaceae bacterium]